MNLVMSDYVSKSVVDRKRVSYHIKLIINLKSN